MITRRILSISSDVSLFLFSFFPSLVCVCSTRTNDACRHKCFDIFEPNVGRKRKINEIFWGGEAWSREEEYEGVKCLSEIITKMANVDRHASHS